jgi:receptor-type tyrosine-protein phosphatase gamma
VNTASADTAYTVSNLRPFTVYSFRVIAVNRIGASPPSLPSYHMMTLREAPRGKPLIVRVQNLSASSVVVSWRPPDNDTIHGEFLGYRLNWRPREVSDATIPEEVNIKVDKL